MNRIWIVIILLGTCCLRCYSQFFLDLEGDYIASIPSNKVKIPSETGTELDLANEFENKTSYAFRIRANYITHKRHLFSALYTPLSIRSKGTIDRAVVSNSVSFKANDPLESIYSNVSYRLTYRYLLVRNEDLLIGLGFSANLKITNIRFQSGLITSTFHDDGFLPMLNFYSLWSPINDWMALLEGDLMIVENERMEDIYIGIGHRFSDMFIVKAGYRVFENFINKRQYISTTCINNIALGVFVTF